MSFYFFAWAANIVLGFEVVTAKLMSRHLVKDPWVLNFFWSFAILLFMVPVALLNRVGMPAGWGNISIAALLMAISGVLFTFAVYKLDVSIMSPLFSFRALFSILFGYLLLNEILAPRQYILGFVIFAMGILVHLDERFSVRTFFRWPTLFFFLSIAGFSLASVYTNKAIAENGYWAATLWMLAVTQVALLPTIPLFQKGAKIFTSWNLRGLAVLGVIDVAGTLLINKAFAENVSISGTILSLPISIFIAFFLSLFAPRLLEHHSLKVYAVRFSATAIMVIAALNL